MSGLFNTLNTASKGLMASQTALHTTGHNISNANTPGYSRQRVELKADLPYNFAGVGQLGTGVKMDSVMRIVNDYVSKQIRQENGTMQEFAAKYEIMEQIEVIFNEPSNTSLNADIGKMFDAWIELSKNPELQTSKTIVVEQSKTLADTYNKMMNQLGALETESHGMIDKNIQDFNANLGKLESLNRQIFNVAVKGSVPNDLLDQRDMILEDLASFMDVDVDIDKYGRASVGVNGKNDNLIQAGQGAVELTYIEGIGIGRVKDGLLIDGNDNPIMYDAKHIDKDGYFVDINGKYLSEDGIHLQPGDKPVKAVDVDGNPLNGLKGNLININSGEIKGRLSALEELRGRREEMDKFGKGLAGAINSVHGQLKNEDGDEIDGDDGKIFIYKDGQLSINQALEKDSNLLESRLDGEGVGGGGKALLISGLRNVKIDFSKDSVEVEIKDGKLVSQPAGNTIGGYYNNIVTSVGISQQHAENMVKNQAVLLGQLDARRESISGVSIGEEITDLLKFSSAYDANARVIQTLSDMLDTLIHRTGV